MEAGNHLFSECTRCGTLGTAAVEQNCTDLSFHHDRMLHSSPKHTFQSGSVPFFCTALAVRFYFSVSGVFFPLGQECSQSGIQSTL